MVFLTASDGTVTREAGAGNGPKQEPQSPTRWFDLEAKVAIQDVAATSGPRALPAQLPDVREVWTDALRRSGEGMLRVQEDLCD